MNKQEEKKIGANNLEVAINQTEKFEVKLPTEIKESEKEMYHIAVIERLHVANEERYITNLKVVKYHQEVYNAFKKDGFRRAGLKNMFILHDPTKPLLDVKKELTAVEKIELIEGLETIDEVNEMLIDETRSTVNKAGEKRIEELNELLNDNA